MNKKNLILAFAMGLLFAKGVMASEPAEGELDINTIVYIEEEEVIELGFDTADYLPEGFDPYEVFFDLNTVVIIEDELTIDFDSKENLPANFDAYALPTTIEGFNYINTDDTILLDFDSKQNLPKGFDVYCKIER